MAWKSSLAYWAALNAILNQVDGLSSIIWKQSCYILQRRIITELADFW